jgi:hypothetical protein
MEKIMLTRQQIIDANDIETEKVNVPEWNGEVFVRGLMQIEKDKWTLSMMLQGEVSIDGATAKLCALCIVDENNQLLFTLDDIEILQTKSAAAIDRVFQVAQRLSGMVQDIEETVKNSVKTPILDSD